MLMWPWAGRWERGTDERWRTWERFAVGGAKMKRPCTRHALNVTPTALLWT